MGGTESYPNLPDTSPVGQPLDWAWLRGARSEWGVQPKPSARGLTMMDIAVGSYGEVPERPGHRSMAPRGADVDPDTPDMGYLLNAKTDVWALNVRELYEEAVARQWSATRTSRGVSSRSCRATSSTPSASSARRSPRSR